MNGKEENKRGREERGRDTFRDTWEEFRGQDAVVDFTLR